MEDPSDSLENIWDRLLSRVPEQVRSAYSGLRIEEKQAVLKHLRKMSTEPGWHPEQRRSAEAALKALVNVDR
jgi:hypothetical protein